MTPRLEVLPVDGELDGAGAAALPHRIDEAFAAGADWVAVDLGAAAVTDPVALAQATRRAGVVVCGGPGELRRELDAAGVVATRRLLDVRIAARARHGDGLKRRLELLALPRGTRGI